MAALPSGYVYASSRPQVMTQSQSTIDRPPRGERPPAARRRRPRRAHARTGRGAATAHSCRPTKISDILTRKIGLPRKSSACALNISRPEHSAIRKPTSVHGTASAASLVARHAAAEPEQAQVDDDDRAEQQPESGDVHDLDAGIGPQRFAHEAPDAGRFDRMDRARHRERATRSSVGLAGDGDALGAHLLGLVAVRVALDGDGAPTFSASFGRPRFSIRDGGASTAIHVFAGVFSLT